MQTMLSGKSTVAGLRSPQCSSRPRVAVAARAQATTTVVRGGGFATSCVADSTLSLPAVGRCI